MKNLSQDLPCSLFVAMDNQSHQVVAFSFAFVDKNNINRESNIIPFEQLDHKFKKFQDSYLAGKDLVDLPDYSFGRINLRNTELLQQFDLISKSDICFLKNKFDFYQTFKDTYILREKEKVINQPLLPDDVWHLPERLNRFINWPEAMDLVLINYLNELKKAPQTIQSKCLEIIRKSQSYSLNRIREDIEPTSLEKIHILDVIIPYLKGDDDRGYDMKKLYNCMYSSSPKLLNRSEDYLLKQIEFCVDKYYQKSPDLLIIPSDFIRHYQTFFPGKEDHINHRQINEFFNLSYINTQREQKSGLFLETAFQMSVEKLIILQLERLRNDYLQKKDLFVFQERLSNLKNYFLSLDFNQIYLSQAMTDALAQFEKVYLYKKLFSFELENGTQAKLHINNIWVQLMKHEVTCIHQNLPMKYPNTVPVSVIELLLNNCSNVDFNNPVFFVSFKIDREVAEKYTATIADFCDELMGKITSGFIIPFIVVLDKTGASADISILGSNIANNSFEIHTSLSWLKFDMIFEQLREKYLLSVKPQNSIRKVISENLKQIPPEISQKTSTKSRKI